MSIIINFVPILLFVLVFFGSRIYYSIQGIENAFYQISLTTAILPSIVVACIIHKNNTKKTMSSFIDGSRQLDIITMCMVGFEFLNELFSLNVEMVRSSVYQKILQSE